jgi:hypothetical protein
MGKIVPKEDLPMLPQKTVPEAAWPLSTIPATIGRSVNDVSQGLGPLGGF